MKTYDFDQEQILKRIDQQIASILAKLSINTLYLSVVEINTLYPSWNLCGRDAYTVWLGVWINLCVNTFVFSSQIYSAFVYLCKSLLVLTANFGSVVLSIVFDNIHSATPLFP